MSKYVIEIPDDVQYVLLNGKADHKYYTAVHPIAVLEELNSNYINKHYEGLQDEAYQRGLNDAWEAARKIALMDTETSENVTGYFGLFRIMENLTPMQAIEKLKAYEEKKADELKAGDIVDWSGDKYIVSYINNDGRADLIHIEYGSTCESVSPDCFTRTGKYYDITKILEEMRS